ncbi:MAG: ABC transporter permease [Alphaproteobacteria bacterium]|nr:ABC transporter permease [Alphaproteobacteria bacterium]
MSGAPASPPTSPAANGTANGAANGALRRRRLPRQLVIGGTIVGAIVLLAILAPWIAPYSYDAFDIPNRLKGPSAANWLGTDEFGRDVLSRVMVGAGLSLSMGFGATAISLAFGVPLGLMAAYFRGLAEEAIMRTIDVLISVPPIMLGLLVLAVSDPSLWKTMLAVGIIYVPIMTRLSRSVALGLMEEEFIQAARARGAGARWILFHELLPNAWPPIIVESSLRVTFAILLASALSFLGLGPQPPSSDWGLMIAEARQFLDDAPWIAMGPGIALCVLLIGINLVGDGLREVLDPRLKKRGAA